MLKTTPEAQHLPENKLLEESLVHWSLEELFPRFNNKHTEQRQKAFSANTGIHLLGYVQNLHRTKDIDDFFFKLCKII